MRDKGYDFIRFWATLMIVVWHFFTTCRAESIPFPNCLKSLVVYENFDMGAVGVALFFMLSGAVLWKRYKESIVTKAFLKKRLSRILIPHQIGFIIVLAVFYIQNINITVWDNMGILISFFGLGYSSEVWGKFGMHSYYVIGEWFTAVIIITYLLFPLLRKLFLEYRGRSTICIATVFIFNMHFMILSAHSGWFSITNGIMLFWMGMLFEEYKQHINIPWLIGAGIIAVSLLVISPKNIFGLNYFPCFIFSVSVFALLYQVKYNNRMINYISKYNYEIYLVHHRVQLILMPFLLTASSNYVQVGLCFVVLTGLIFFLSEKLQSASNVVLNMKLFRNFK